LGAVRVGLRPAIWHLYPCWVVRLGRTLVTFGRAARFFNEWW
jgi:hypothetical protein